MTRALSGPACVAEDMHPCNVANTVNTLSVDPYNLYLFVGTWDTWHDVGYWSRKIRHCRQEPTLVLLWNTFN